MSRVMALTTLLLFSSGVIWLGCGSGQCSHGSWGPKYGWKCHDDNDERGPQRDIPPERNDPP